MTAAAAAVTDLQINDAVVDDSDGDGESARLKEERRNFSFSPLLSFFLLVCFSTINIRAYHQTRCNRHLEK